MLKALFKEDIQTFGEYLKKRESDADFTILKEVSDILNTVKKEKDKALFYYTKKFDKVELTSLLVSQEEIEEAFTQVDAYFISNLKEAIENITLYHEKQLQVGYEIQKEKGIYLGQRVLPLEKVGVYVPGGRAAYPTTVIMNVIPAKLAKVNEIIMVTPPNKQGKVNPYILVAAKLAGISQIYKVGGAQAIAALAYGSESIPKVDKIVGPGNAYVACAKRLVYGLVDIDMIAGPSEILVIADEKANPKFVASDLISQAEHDPNAASILLSTSETLVEEVNKQLKIQSSMLPKKEIIETSFKNYGISIVCDSIFQCIEYANKIAPEHLELMVENPKDYLPFVKNAGSVFLGYYSCESIGDYFGGCNHVLPTNTTARFASALSCDSFIKKSSYLYYSKEALTEAADKIINLAMCEDLQGHANAIKVRVDYEK